LVSRSFLCLQLGQFKSPYRFLRHNGNAVLDFQPLDLTVAHLLAMAYERDPGWMQAGASLSHNVTAAFASLLVHSDLSFIHRCNNLMTWPVPFSQ
jgi:hypothetical protein